MTSKRSRHNGEGSIYPYPHGFRAYVWVTTPEGTRRRKYISGKTREDVHRKFVALHQIAQRGPVSTTTPTVDVYIAGWLEEVVRPNLAPATASNYDLFTRLYIVPDLGSRRLDKITVRDVQVWVNQLRTRCQCCAQHKDASRATARCCAAGQCCRQVASEWTVHQAWAVLRSALSSAVRDEVVSRNVAALVRMPVPRPEKPTVWTVDQVRRFLESARDEDDPLYAGYALMVILGLRRGEVLGLGWEDVDEERAEARIRWQVQRLGGRLVRRPTKTVTSDGLMPLPDVCLRALQHRRRIEDEWKAAAGDAWQGSGLVLTTRYGTPLDPRNFHRMFKERAAAAGVPVISVHATRRTCASLLVALNVHPRVAMQILRHSQIAVTMDVYSQVTSETTRDALRDLGGQLRTRDRIT